MDDFLSDNFQFKDIPEKEDVCDIHTETNNCYSGILTDDFLSENALQETDCGFDLPSPSRYKGIQTYAFEQQQCLPTSNYFVKHSTDNIILGMDISKCRKFSGLSHENAVNFLTEFQSFVSLYSLDNPKDDKRVPLFCLLLQGPARTWFTTNDLSIKTWSVVQHCFEEKYLDFSASGPSLLLETNNFLAVKLSHHEPLEDSHARLVEKGRRIGKSDIELLSKFISSLADQLAFFVRAGNPGDSSTALSSAKMGEVYGYRTLTPSVAQLKTDTEHAQSHPPRDTLSAKVDKLTDLVETLLHTNDTKDHPHGQDKTVCYKCGGLGHRQFHCLWTGQNASHPQTCCRPTRPPPNVSSMHVDQDSGNLSTLRVVGRVPSGRQIARDIAVLNLFAKDTETIMMQISRSTTVLTQKLSAQVLQWTVLKVITRPTILPKGNSCIFL
ncbi:hypothetical protein KP79_PYT00092 [Mizuhopecten yessoensis]|uniref:CCHC-type domain-containing protein n=1 Tax=Mizuhopecten yessoensis TaxID=6573 RepID=A0A210R567_MIZYE|nr:hypothetical protein KP79_PYT00092 [Mizuhopecten yessoensis]